MKRIKVVFALKDNVKEDAQILRDVNTSADSVMCSVMVADTGHGYGTDGHPYTTAWEWQRGHLHKLSQGHHPNGTIIVAVIALPADPKAEVMRVIAELEARIAAYRKQYNPDADGVAARKFIAEARDLRQRK